MKRKTGYYWVKRTNCNDWEPALYLKQHLSWQVIGCLHTLSEQDIAEVKKDECNREVYLRLPE